MPLEEINYLISLLENNVHFKKMLNPYDNELNQIYQIAKEYKMKYDEEYLQKSINDDGIGSMKANCSIDDLENLVIDFFKSLNIPDETLGKVKQSIKLDRNVQRAKSSMRFDKEQNKYVCELKIGYYDESFEYIKTLVHETAHCIRNFAKIEELEKNPDLYKEDGLIAEIESKEIEEIFYQYLMKQNIKLIKTHGGDVRGLTSDDLIKQRLHEIDHEKQFIKRALQEAEIVQILRENMKMHGSYQFTQESLEETINKYGLEIIKNIKDLKFIYLSDKPFVYAENYDVENGKHIANEFRFICARLITEYIRSNNIQQNFGEYLTAGNMTTIANIMKYFNVGSIEDLIENQVGNYIQMREDYLSSHIQLTPELETIFSNILNDSKHSSSELMEQYARLPEYQGLINKISVQSKQLEEQLKNIRINNPQMSDEDFFISILTNYTKNIIDKIKIDYSDKLTPEIIDRLDNFSLDIINDPQQHGDMTAHSDEKKVSINYAIFATDAPNLENKIIRAMGTMPHELFHFMVKMLKEKGNVDERMIFELNSGEKVPVKGMVGHMLNEGFVEKLSNEFCQRNNIYKVPNPSYIQFTKLCDYIMRNNPNIDEQFLIQNDYESILEIFTSEAKGKYKEIERAEYIENFELKMADGNKRKVTEQEIIKSYNERIQSKKHEEIKTTNEEKKSAAELRREAWKEIKEQHFSNPKLDLEQILLQQQINEQNRNIEIGLDEEIKSSGRKY